MAEVIVLNNVFNTADSKRYKAKEGTTVEEFLYSINLDKQLYTALVEVYDPETGDTTFVPIEDSLEEDLRVCVTVNGEVKDTDYVIGETDSIMVAVAPAGGGASGAMDAFNIGSIILGAVLCVVGVVCCFTGAGSTIGTALIIAGATMIASGVFGLFASHYGNEQTTETGSKRKNDDQGETDPTVTGTRNQNLTGNAYPLVIGKIGCTPYVIGSPYNELEYGNASNGNVNIFFSYRFFLSKVVQDGEEQQYYHFELLNMYLSAPVNKDILISISGEAEADYVIAAGGMSVSSTLSIEGSGVPEFKYSVSATGQTVSGSFDYTDSNVYLEPVKRMIDDEWVTTGYEIDPFIANKTSTIHTSLSLQTTLDKKELFGHVESYNLLLAVGYAPLYIENILLDQLPFATNPNHILSGLMTYNSTPSFNGRNGEKEIKSQWDGNKASVEISQFGHHRTVYPFTVLQKTVDATLLYCYDNKYEEIATERSISWQGGTFPTGMRTNTIYFSESIPYKVTVMLDFQGGLYKEYTKDGDYYYSRIPMNLVVQWRPYYRYIQDHNIDSDEGSPYSYNGKVASPDYGINRYTRWRNFDTSVVPRVVYNGSEMAREVNSNFGLTAGTSTYSNPNWDGVEAFRFDKFSCGTDVYNGEESGSWTNINGGKDEMRFEISATLTQEDILDLINRNPKSIAAGKIEGDLYGKTDCVLDSIQVRVIRLTPCYIDKVRREDNYTINHQYSDVVKWRTLKTYCIEKQKLLDDIDIAYEQEDGSFKPSIDCNSATYEASGTWNTWDIAKYYSRPLSDADQYNMCTLGIKVYPDQTGYISNSLDKVYLTASAVTPALKNEHLRWWYIKDSNYYYYDSFDTLSDLQEWQSSPSTVIYEKPMFNATDWTLGSSADFEGAIKYDDNYYYQNINEEWEKRFYPQKVDKTSVSEIDIDTDGKQLMTDKGLPVIKTVDQGNDWLSQMERIMSEHKDSAGRWVASSSFINTFTNQNAIMQALGFMIGTSLGKDAYSYNLSRYASFMRLWYRNGNDCWYYDTSVTDEYNNPYVKGNIGFNSSTWSRCSEVYYKSFERKEINASFSYTMKPLDGNFNQIALKEAAIYTDSIDIGRHGALSYKCNMYVHQQKKVANLMQTILIAARAYWFFDELGRFEYHNDRPRKNPVMLITDENSISSNNTRSFPKGIAGYHMTFSDEANGFQQGEIYVLRDGQTRERHTRDITDMNLEGVTNALQAWAMGAYFLAQAITQRESWSRKLNHVGSALTIGSLVEVQSSTLEIGTDTSGRIEDLLEDETYIYGFTVDNMYEFRNEYTDEGFNVQGCSIMQAAANVSSRIVTLRFAKYTVQKEGITVDGVTYKNLTGMTNLVLLDKPINKNTKELVGQESEDNKNITRFVPKNGDIVAFGNVGKITQKAVVYSLTPDDKGCVTVGMYPYYDSLYTAGKQLPVYKTSMTKKPRKDEMPVDSNVKWSQLTSSLIENTAITDEKIDNIKNGTADVAAPDNIRDLIAKAKEDGIYITWSPAGVGLRNTIRYYKIEISKDNGDNWEELDYPDTNSYVYYFDRNTDGYPESSDLIRWKIRAKAVNVYEKESEAYNTVGVNVDAYGTWMLQEPIVYPRVSDRTITLLLAQPERSDRKQVYGNITYRVSIKRPDNDTLWFKPATSLDPYANELNYREGIGSAEKMYYAESNGTYVQTMPLKGQTSNNIVDTLYTFTVCSQNEAGGSDYTDVNVTALCTSIRDLVKANETAKSAYISQLSALSANVGTISQGAFGNDNNMWDLSTFVDDQGYQHYEGKHHVGGNEQYLHVDPIIENGMPTGEYNITFKVGSFELSSVSSQINGELIIQKDPTSLDRTRITPKGTYYEHRENGSDLNWNIIASESSSGILTSQVYSDKQLFIGNQSLTQRREAGFDLGDKMPSDNSRVYHFDTDILDQKQSTMLKITTPDGSVVTDDMSGNMYLYLAGGNDNVYVNGEIIDSTPAILAVAPYATIGRSLGGQYKINFSIPSPEHYTVDYWMQFLDSQSQVLFDIKTGLDEVRFIILDQEIYWESPYPYTLENWKNSFKYNYTEEEIEFLFEDFKSENPDEIPYNHEIEIPITDMFNKIEWQGIVYADSDYVDEGYWDDESHVYVNPLKKYSDRFHYYTFDGSDYSFAIVSEADYPAMVKTGLYESSVVYNKPKPKGQALEHIYWTAGRDIEEGKIVDSVDISLEELGFDENSWCHIGFVGNGGKINLYLQAYDKENTLRKKTFSYNKVSAGNDSVGIEINSSQIITLIDELLVDSTTEESESDFTEHSKRRIPFGSINPSDAGYNDFMVIACRDVNKFNTNIFDTPVFDQAVRKVISKIQEGN